MQCSKTFSIEIEEPGACCFSSITNIPIAATPTGMVYAATDNRIFAGAVTDVVAIDVATDTVAATIAGVAGSLSTGVYSPVNNRVYFVNFLTAELEVINPTTMAHIGTISPPAGITFLQEGCYDTTNDLFYFPALGVTPDELFVVRFNPATGVMDVLVTVPVPVAPAAHNWGRRGAHCILNNQIYMPYVTDDGLGNVVALVVIYTVAGGVVGSFVATGATSSVGSELIYWDDPNQVLYYLSDSAGVGLFPGAIAINPVGNITVGQMNTGFGNMGCASISPTCMSLNILTSDGNMHQFSTDDYSTICITAVVSGVSASSQIASSASKVYAPETAGTDVKSMSPP